jgi:hypothetical protein
MGDLDLTKVDVLPDSRARDPKGLILRSPMGNMVPIFCASCHKQGGYCPEENMHFICWLCNDCAGKYGEIAGTMFMPDEVFWKKVEQAQLEEHGRLLSEQELQTVVQEGASPLARLIQTGR